MRRSLFVLGLLFSFPARAELLKLEETGPDLRASLKIGGKDYALPIRLLRSKAAAGEGALLVDAGRENDLTNAALARAMTVANVDLTTLPPPARAEALRDLLPRLREKVGAKRVLGRGAEETADALAATGELLDGLLLQDANAAAAGKAPRSIEVWGSDAYWRRAPRARAAGPEPANRRSYFLAGTASGGGANCVAPSDARARDPALRALLVVLDDWTRGVKPPASRVPAATDLVKAGALVWPKIPGLPAPPPGEGMAPKIDADGNETSGLRLPDRLLPIATFTGFAAQKDPKGPPCAAGGVLPFPATKADREKTGDPRPSLVERYGSRAYFVATMRVVADKLVKERLLLKEDADAYVATAKQAPF
ncbi:alpha/beta hydrolase domain-containing protein [Methylocystis parvus]|uniref:alpha/beta hydrolase domain-containing protein n=1 Tax=Methylocystis parvus TaxID=134 RepID=UPI003C71ADD7